MQTMRTSETLKG